MKSTILWALVVLNAVLLLGFISRLTPSNTAIAQPGGAAPRRPGDYIMIPGEVTGGSAGVVYVVDTTNGLLSAMTYDQSSNPPGIAMMQKIDLTQIFAKGVDAAQGAKNRGGAGR